MHSCLYAGEVMHQRLRPRRHRFSYRFTGWYLDLDELTLLDQTLQGFSFRRRGLFRFEPRDFGPGNRDDLKAYISEQLLAAGLSAPHRVCLLCQPRCLGYLFNSLSVYFCYNREGTLTATLYEVSNTFGERHLYLIAADACRPLRQQADKAMYVSPFIAMDCRYRFQVQPPAERFSLLILQDDSSGPLFQARWSGERRPLEFSALARLLLTPSMSFKTLAAIHWEALKLWIKRVPLVRYQKTSHFQVSRGLCKWQEEN
ncbi:DUF1365 domain-containing protein [Motiliproteus sp. SC1-56]|uniref:DUF1365 domain-containing protein n=1 Tax=Motiliproteus sp. SC1-56 TaxID=2799565 RepID=UPI001A8C7383|nr:DUF1365 domain-containing protein [Motiliproteus sp. SC1-56]